MTTPEALNALADRVEREEPSRGLDIDIACAALGWEKERQGGYIGQTPPDYAWNLRPIGRAYWDDGSRKAPPYTTSLDAAVTLVPPDCWRETNGPRKYLNVPAPSPNRWKAEVAPWKTGMPCFGWAETEAMAICAAALRARAADMQARAVGAPHPARTA